MDELMAPKSSYPTTLVFGKSLVIPELIKEYEEKGFFPCGDGRAPTSEETPTSQPDEVVVFRDFFTAGLRFPCNALLPSILDWFFREDASSDPNSFLELSKFFWIMRTFECLISANIFTRCFELHIQRKIIKLDNGNLYEAHYGCCTFNTRRKNASQKIERNQLAPCSNDKWMVPALVLCEGRYVGGDGSDERYQYIHIQSQVFWIQDCGNEVLLRLHLSWWTRCHRRVCRCQNLTLIYISRLEAC